jgi:Secretion system C-terminal sorting domain
MKTAQLLKIMSSIVWIFLFINQSFTQIIPLNPIWKPMLVTPNVDRLLGFVFDNNQHFYSQEAIIDSVSKLTISNKVFKMDTGFIKSDSIDLLSLLPLMETFVSMRRLKDKLELLNCHFKYGHPTQDFNATTIDLNTFKIESSNSFTLVDSIYSWVNVPYFNDDDEWIMTFKKGTDLYNSAVGLIKFDKKGVLKRYRTLNKFDGYGPIIEQPDKNYAISGAGRVLFMNNKLDSTGLFICGSEFNDASISLKKGGLSEDNSTVYLGFGHPKVILVGNDVFEEHNDRLVIVRNKVSTRFTYPVNIGYGYEVDFFARTLTTGGQYAYFGTSHFAVKDTCSYFSVLTLNKVDSTGNLIWQKKFGSNNYVSGSEYHTLPDGRILMIFAKWYFANQTLGFGLRGIDYYYLLIDQNGDVLNTNIEATAVQDVFEISPNPATDLIKIKSLNQINDFNVLISDNSGKTVFAQPYLADMEINVKHLLSGIYFVQLLKNGRVVETKKLIKL